MRIRGAVLERIGAPRPYAESRPITVADLDLEPPGDTELLVRIEAAGLCHSDLSVVDGNRVRPVPMLLGHEAAGIVEAVGTAVSDVAVGQRVVMTFLPRCGDCTACATDGLAPCLAGSAANAAGTLLSGGHASGPRRCAGTPSSGRLGVRHPRRRRPPVHRARRRGRAAGGCISARLRGADRRWGGAQRRTTQARIHRGRRRHGRSRHGRDAHRAGPRRRPGHRGRPGARQAGPRAGPRRPRGASRRISWAISRQRSSSRPRGIRRRWRRRSA